MKSLKQIATSAKREEPKTYINLKDLDTHPYVRNQFLFIERLGERLDKFGHKNIFLNCLNKERIHNVLVITEATLKYLSKGIDTLQGKIILIKGCKKSLEGYWAIDCEIFEDDEGIFTNKGAF